MSIDDISDPRLASRLRTLIAEVEKADLYNNPLTVSERIGSGSGPGSREPGRQQCKWGVTRMLGILDRCTASAAQCNAQAVPREHRTIVVSVGGIPLDPSKTVEVPKRRVSVSVRQGRILARFSDEQ